MSKAVSESSFDGVLLNVTGDEPLACVLTESLDPVICEETEAELMHDVDGGEVFIGGAKDLNEKIGTICRCCLAERDDLISIFDTENDVYSMITMLVSIQISSDDAFPQNICVFCFDQLHKAVSFKQQIEAADTTLQQCLNERFTEEIGLQQPEIIEQSFSELPFEHDDERVVEIFDDPVVEEDYESGYLMVLENVEPSTDELPSEIPESKLKTNSKKTYNCSKCDKKFINRQLFAKHMKAHQNLNRYSCNICNRTFSHESNFEAHMKTHDQQNDVDSNNDSFKCDKCDMSFIIERDLYIHGSIHDEESGGLKCRECFKEFPNLQKLRRHVKTHYQDKPIKCDECGRGFPEMASLTRHYRVHTNEQRERKYICSCCNKSYYDSHSLSIHVRTHTGEKPWACEKCDKRFIDSRLLSSHMRTHSNERKYACTICDKSFTHRSTLVSHMRIHTGEKPFVCPICNKSFGQSSNLILHKRVHSGEKPYKCTRCPKAFGSSSSLALHVRTHTGEKPYGCTICGKYFARYNLTIHMRTHTGEKPYECSDCPRKFKTSAQLVQHKRTHTGEKPYACGVCDKRWTSSSYLKKHMQTHGESQANAENSTESILMEQNEHHRLRIEELQSDAEFNENAMLVNDLLASVGQVSADVLQSGNVDVPELSTNDSNPGLDLNNAINPNILRIQQCKNDGNESGGMYAMEV